MFGGEWNAAWKLVKSMNTEVTMLSQRDLTRVHRWIRAVSALFIVGVGLTNPPQATGAVFQTCVWCAEGATCQPWLIEALCQNFCGPTTKPVHCQYQPEPECNWDEVLLVCSDTATD